MFLDSIPPFLKWPGGKRWLTRHAALMLAELKYGRYFEPFLGGGALFFSLAPKRATISDINPDLINVYKQVKTSPAALVQRLKRIPVDASNYERLRRLVPRTPLSAATRMLYLNRTSFGGMYRLNRRGEFNVPFGGGERTPEAYWRDDLLVHASCALRRAKIACCDFEDSFGKVESGDLVYCDPTYTTSHNNNGFVRYNETNFAWADQKRLAACCKRAADAGAIVIVSNAHHEDLRSLFAAPRHHSIPRQSSLCPDARKRGVILEYLFGYNVSSRHWKRLTEDIHEE
jgi:DNA adenine methylase